jgi:hypothetical protein
MDKFDISSPPGGAPDRQGPAAQIAPGFVGQLSIAGA